jgi:hypothetical protein
MYDIFGQWEYIVVNSRGEKQGMLSAEKVYYSNANLCRKYTQHRFLMLSKLPVPDYAIGNKPKNLWFGFSLTKETLDKLLPDEFRSFDFVSLEPFDAETYLINFVRIKLYIKWLIVGCQTNPIITPNKDIILRVINEMHTEDSRSYPVPVFIKKPLSDIFNINCKEYPKFLKMKVRKND